MVHQRPQIAREETGKKATTMVSRRGLTKYPTTTPLKGTSGRHLIQLSPLRETHTSDQLSLHPCRSSESLPQSHIASSAGTDSESCSLGTA